MSHMPEQKPHLPVLEGDNVDELHLVNLSDMTTGTGPDADIVGREELGSYKDGEVDPEKRPLLYRYYAISKVARALTHHRLASRLVTAEYHENTRLYDKVRNGI